MNERERRGVGVGTLYVTLPVFHNWPHFLTSLTLASMNKIEMGQKSKLTISISEGIRDRKSASSLLSTAFGLRIFFVNLFIPDEVKKKR